MLNNIKKKINKKFENLHNEIYEVRKIVENTNNLNNLNSDKLEELKNIINTNEYYDSFYLKYQNIELLPYVKSNNKNKKVLLCGFYGAPNLGDELMLETILKYLPKNIDLTIMLSENIDYDITSLPKCNLIHYPKNMLDINQIAQYFDTIIFGGGALIDDYDFGPRTFQMPLGYVLVNLSKRALILEKEVLLIGLSCSNKLTNNDYIKKLEYVIQNCQYVSFRDNNSINYLSKLFDTKNIILSNDIVFANENLFNLKKKTKDSVLNIGLIMICNDNTYENTKIIINEIENYFKNEKIIINLIPFYDYNNHDVKFYKKIEEEINKDNINVLDYVNDSKEICNIIDAQDYVITMRYHGALISLLRNKKTMSIIYDSHSHYTNKMNYLYDKYGFEKCIVNYSEFSKEILKRKLKQLFNCDDAVYNLDNYKTETMDELIGIMKKYL